MHTHTHTRGFTTEVDPCFLSPDTSPLMIAPQDMCIVCVCVCAKEQHSGFICFPFLLSMMQSHSKSLTPIWFPYWLVSLFFLLSLIIQVYGGFFSYFSGGFFFYLFVPLTSFYTAWENYLIWRLQQKDQSITKVQKMISDSVTPWSHSLCLSRSNTVSEISQQHFFEC